MFTLLLILIFIRPLVSSLAFPYANFLYSYLLLAFLFIWIASKKIPLSAIKPIDRPLIIFTFSILISVIFAQDKINGIRELYKYITGISLFLISASLSPKNQSRVIRCIILSGLIISLLAIYQYFFGFQHLLNYIAQQKITDSFILDYASRRRVFFPFITPNTLGGYLIMIIPLALTRPPIEKKMLLLPLCLALFLTQSLGALLSLFLGLGVYLYLKRGFKKRKVFFLLGLLLITVLIFMARTTAQQHNQPAFSTVMRLSYWKDTLRIILAHPLIGVGLGNFNLLQSRYAHNSYLQIWAETGIFSLIAFLWLVLSIIKSSLKKLNNASYKNQLIGLLTSCITFLIHNFIDFTFFLPEASFIWWALIGLLSSSHQQWRPSLNFTRKIQL